MLVPTVRARAASDISPPSRSARANIASPQYSSVSTRVPSMSNSTASRSLRTYLHDRRVAGVVRLDGVPSTVGDRGGRGREALVTSAVGATRRGAAEAAAPARGG